MNCSSRPRAGTRRSKDRPVGIARTGRQAAPAGSVLLLGLAVAFGGRGLVRAADSSPAELRAHLSGLSAEEKLELQRKHARFRALPPEEQQRLREFHEALAQDEKSDPLRHVMEGYATWLKTLSSGQRAELLSLPPEKRVAEIKRLIEQQEAARLRGLASPTLSDEDTQTIIAWMEALVKDREPEILAALPNLKEMLDRIDDPKRRHMALMWSVRFTPHKDLVKPTPQDIERLQKQLSAAARQELDRARTAGHAVELAQRYIFAAMFRSFMPPVRPDELREFYSKELEAKKREELESLPPDRMRAELTRLYHEHRFRQRGELGPAPPWGGMRGFGPWRRPGDWKPPTEGGNGPPPFERPKGFPRGDPSRAKSAPEPKPRERSTAPGDG